MIGWYLCNYEAEPHPVHGVVRIPAINRHITSNDRDRFYDGTEVVGNRMLIKVSGPKPLHDALQADPAFQAVPATRPGLDILAAGKSEVRMNAQRTGFLTTGPVLSGDVLVDNIVTTVNDA